MDEVEVEVGLETTTRVEVTKRVPGTTVTAAVVDGVVESVRLVYDVSSRTASGTIFICVGSDTQKLFMHLINACREVLNECVDIKLDGFQVTKTEVEDE